MPKNSDDGVTVVVPKRPNVPTLEIVTGVALVEDQLRVELPRCGDRGRVCAQLSGPEFLRHSDVSVTQRCYIKPLAESTKNAMSKIGRFAKWQ